MQTIWWVFLWEIRRNQTKLSLPKIVDVAELQLRTERILYNIIMVIKKEQKTRETAPHLSATQQAHYESNKTITNKEIKAKKNTTAANKQKTQKSCNENKQKMHQ